MPSQVGQDIHMHKKCIANPISIYNLNRTSVSCTQMPLGTAEYN